MIRDARNVIAIMFIAGYYASVWIVLVVAMDDDKRAMVRDMLLPLGPLIGIIFNALFRTTQIDEQREENTKEAFMALSANAPSGEPQPVKVINPPSEPVPTTEGTMPHPHDLPPEPMIETPDEPQWQR